MSNNIKNAGYNVIKTLATLLFPTLTFAYASRIFGADGMGRINFAKSVVALATAVAMLGVQNYGIREASRIKDNRGELTAFFKEILLINGSAMLVVYVILAILVAVSSTLQPYTVLLAIFSISILANVLGVEWLYIAMDEFRYIAVRTCIIQGAAFACLFLLVRDADDMVNYALIQTFATSGSYFWNLFHSRKFVDWGARVKLNIRKHIEPIGRIFLTTIFIKIFTDMDVTMLGVMSTDYATGLYSAAYKISLVMSSIIGAAFAILQPKIAAVADGNRKEAIEITRIGFQGIVAIALPITVGEFLYSSTMIYILNGSGFSEAVLTSQILAFRTLLSPINGLFLTHFLISIKEDKKGIIITGAAAISNILLNALLIPLMAQDGAAVATVFSEAIETIIIVFIMKRYIRLGSLLAEIWKNVVAVIVMGIVVCGVNVLVSNIFLELGLGVVLGAVVYFGTLVVLHYSFLQMLIKRVLPRKREKGV